MWPWEHAAVAYIVYSLLTRITTHEAPGAGATVAVLVGSQLPDLIDKPLAWWLHVLPSGRSLAHSLLFSVLFFAVALWIGSRRDRPDLGIALGAGSLLHLPGDVFYPVLLGHGPDYKFLFYPFISREAYAGPGAIIKVSSLASDFLAFLQTARGTLYLSGELALFFGALWLWVWDGKPGLGMFSRHIRRTIMG